MSWKRPVALVALLLTLATPASAQKGAWLLGVDAGLAMPQSDFGDFWDSGFLFAASAGYRMSPAFELGALISFADHDPTDEYEAFLELTDETGTFKFVNYGLYGKFLFSTSGSVEPYGMAALGLSSLSGEFEGDTFSVEESQTAFAVGGGLGVDFYPSPNFGLGARATYMYPFVDEDEIGHDNAGSIQIMGGIRFKVTPGE